MGVRLIMGPAGSGKSRHCIEGIKDALLEEGRKEKLVFLVPEQATYQVERAILADERIEGYSDAYIVSFNRLGFWLADHDLALEPLTKTAKFLIISRILRENADKFKIFGSMAEQSGMVEKIAAMITELYQCGKSSLDLMEIVRKEDESATLNGKIAMEKFSDIALIYDEYVDFLTGRFENPDAQLNYVKKHIAESKLFNGCRLWVDGFSSFTHAEYEVLTELFKISSAASITLCIEAASRREDVFAPTVETKEKIETILAENSLASEPPVVLETCRRFKTDELAFLERNIFAEAGSSAPLPAEGNISIVNPLNVSSEVGYIVDQINHLVFEQGCRYRDIAIVLNDIDTYEVYIRQLFADFEVPYFLDKRRSCLQHPLVHLLIAAMRVIRGGFERVDVFSFLKNPLAGFDRIDIQMLENYCICEGISAQQWLSDKKWKSSSAYGFDDKKLNTLRKEVSSDLIWLHENMSDNIDAVRFAGIVSEFMNSLGVENTLARWITESGSDSDQIDHGQVYEQVNTVLSEMASIFGTDRMESGVYIGSFCDSLKAVTSSLIPPGQDQVIISQIDRSRLPEVRAVFIAGALAKTFPITVSDSSLLTDTDRLITADGGCELEQGKIAKLHKRDYLSYIALTRASEKLFISWPRTDGSGRKQQHSDIVTQLRRLFPDIDVSQGISFDSLDTLRKKWQLKDYFCINGGRNNYARFSGMNIKPVLDAVCDDEILADSLVPLQRAERFSNNAKLDRELLNSLQKDTLETSVTQLQTFASCPYRYFANYTLGLKPREVFGYDPLKKGSFYHNVIDKLSRHLIANSLGFADLDASALISLSEEKIKQIRAEDEHFNSIIESSRHNSYIFETMCGEIFELIRSLRLMAGVSDFKLASSEMDFGFASGGAFELHTSGGHKVRLKGKIDRVDMASNLAVVYDYKSGSKPQMDWQKFFNGLELQLPVYMLSLNSSVEGLFSNVKAVGGFFVPVASGDGNERSEDGLGALALRKARGIYDGRYYNYLDNSLEEGAKSSFYAMALKKDGGFNKNSSGDMLEEGQLDIVLDFARDKICEIADGIMSGDISAEPVNSNGRLACEYCDYRPLCRFDRLLNSSRLIRELSGDKKKAFFELTGEGSSL